MINYCDVLCDAVEESDIIDLEKRYWLLKAQSRTGRFDLETFVPLVSPPIHLSVSEGMHYQTLLFINILFINIYILWKSHGKFESVRISLTVNATYAFSIFLLGLFHAFDENRDNHIDFKEISCGLSACCRGPLAERQKCTCTSFYIIDAF